LILRKMLLSHRDHGERRGKEEGIIPARFDNMGNHHLKQNPTIPENYWMLHLLEYPIAPWAG